MQAQYSLKWTRIGGVLRQVRRRPALILKLPIMIARELRADAPRPGSAPVPDSVPRAQEPEAASLQQGFHRHQPVEARDQRPVLSILDQFTESCLAPELTLVPADRSDFHAQLKLADVVLTETAWRGNDGAWSYMFNKYDNGNDLDRLLQEAELQGVPSVIWNKEDPVNYELFLPVVRRFDYVLTTDADILDRYRADLGHDRVGSMTFAAQPALHNPAGRPTDMPRTICFAGAWRGGKYPGRADRLEQLLDAAQAAGELVIYDREPQQQDAGSGFPERFNRHIKGTLSYPQMVLEYRRHSCFLNVNTVSESSTMLSRRVLEILACRTPVVSTASKSIETHLSDVVLTPSSPAEARAVVEELVHDADHRDRLGQRGYRAVMSRHTYQHRVADMFELIGRDGFPGPTEPSIDVICVTNRPEHLHDALDNYRRQRHENKRLTLVTNSEDFDDIAVRNALAEFPDSQLIALPSRLTLGECLNEAIIRTSGEYFAKFDDDDEYGEHYLSDMVLATRFADASVYGKRSIHAYVEGADCTVLRHEGHEFQQVNLVMGGTLLVRRRDLGDIRFEAVQRGTDTRFLNACRAAGLRIYSTDRFNYLMVRRAEVSHHTWRIADDEFMATCRKIGDGHLSNLVLI